MECGLFRFFVEREDMNTYSIRLRVVSLTYSNAFTLTFEFLYL